MDAAYSHAIEKTTTSPILKCKSIYREQRCNPFKNGEEKTFKTTKMQALSTGLSNGGGKGNATFAQLSSHHKILNLMNPVLSVAFSSHIQHAVI